MESDLLSALYEAQLRHIVLIPGARQCLTLWAPGIRIPTRRRQMIRRHRAEILAMIGRSDMLTCPNPDLHQHWHETSASTQICATCAHVGCGW